MRPAHAPLLQAHKGSPAGNSPRGLFSVQRQRGLLVLALVLLAAALLLLLQRSGGGRVVGGGGVGSGNSLTLMGAAVQGLDSSSDAAAAAASASASASPQSLEEALQRARHAAALPPPDFRSHAEGLVLSPGAAKAAAACSGERCELIMRFVLAAEDVAHLVESGGCAVQHCPDALGVGLRPLPYTPHAFGNRCEPLWNRGALELVRQLADSSWQALEWGTGGSTAWFLTRLAHLTSIEAAPGFAAKARGVAELQFDAAALQQRWDMRVLPPAGGVTTFVDAESAERFADYCAAAVVPPGTLFDLVSVAGFARVACLQRAVQLVRPQGGLLVLPQAQRATYAGAERLVPPHWLRLTDAHSFGTTYVWMSMEAP